MLRGRPEQTSVKPQAAGGHRFPRRSHWCPLGAEDFYGEHAGGTDIRAAPRSPANRYSETVISSSPPGSGGGLETSDSASSLAS